MKSIYNLCNENITNSLHSLYEASILDIDANIKTGDELVANIEMDFNKLRVMVMDKPIWKLKNRKTFNSHYQFVNNAVECPNLMKYFGYDKLNYLQINIDRNVIEGTWFVRFFGFNNRGGVKVTDCVSTETQLPGNSKLVDALKFIDSKTKDIETLKQFLEDNKRQK